MVVDQYLRRHQVLRWLREIAEAKLSAQVNPRVFGDLIFARRRVVTAPRPASQSETTFQALSVKLGQ